MATIRPLQASDLEAWVRLRNALWPSHSGDELRLDAERMLAGDPTPYLRIQTFVAEDDDGLCGFLEASLRGNAEGCTEMGSDAHADNNVSRKAHKALGYAEKRSVAHFHKSL